MISKDHHKPEDRNESPSSLELKPVSNGTLPRPLAIRLPSTTTIKTAKGGKRKRNISVGMIKRVEGGGVGLVNPMGWYDGERMESETRTPDPSPMEELPPSHTEVEETRREESTDAESMERALQRADESLARTMRGESVEVVTQSPARMDSDE
jgi:hypothetical protein